MQTDRKELEGALRALKGAVSSRPGIPALTGVLVEGDGAGLATLTATDLETTATARVGAGDGAGFRALVPFKILADTVKAATAERVGLERVDGHVKVAGASIRLLPEEDFPKISEPAELLGSVDVAELVRAIESVAPAASRDEMRPVLTGCLLEVLETGATLAATDSYRLHVAELGAGWVRPGRYIIPARTLAYVAKRIGKRPAYSRVAIRCSDGAVMFELGTVRVTVRLIEGEFPNWRQLMPEPDIGTAVRYDLAELTSALKAAGPFARDTNPVRFTVDEVLGVSLSASSPDLGDWSARLESAEVRGESITVAFSPAYLAGCVAAVAAGAELRLRDGLKPAALTSADGVVRALVMPVRPPVGASWQSGPANPYDGVPGVGVNAPHEPSAAERAHGEEVEDSTDPGAAESGQPAEPEDAPDDAPVVPAVMPADEHDARIIRKANDDEPEGNGGEAWAELADLGEVDGVKVRLITGPDGRPSVDVRRFVASRRYNGPTKKGVCIRASSATRLAELIGDAAGMAETE